MIGDLLLGLRFEIWFANGMHTTLVSKIAKFAIKPPVFELVSLSDAKTSSLFGRERRGNCGFVKSAVPGTNLSSSREENRSARSSRSVKELLRAA